MHSTVSSGHPQRDRRRSQVPPRAPSAAVRRSPQRGRGPADRGSEDLARVSARLPRGPKLPVGLQTLAMRTRQRPYLERCRRRYGPLFTVRVIGFGPAVIVSDPVLVKRVFRADTAVLHAGTGSPLRDLLGPNSLLGIDERQHMEQRKLLLPAVQGRSDAAVRADHRRDRRRGDRPMARAGRVLDHQADATDHAAGDPAGGVRRRRRADAQARGAAAAVDGARQQAGARLVAAPRPRRVVAVGALRRAARSTRRSPRRADRRCENRSASSRAGPTCWR